METYMNDFHPVLVGFFLPPHPSTPPPSFINAPRWKAEGRSFLSLMARRKQTAVCYSFSLFIMLATLIPFFGVKKPVTCGALPFTHLFIYFNQSPAEQQELQRFLGGVGSGGGDEWGLCFFGGPSHSLGPQFGSGWQRLSAMRGALRGHFQAQADSLYVGQRAGACQWATADFFLVLLAWRRRGRQKIPSRCAVCRGAKKS